MSDDPTRDLMAATIEYVAALNSGNPLRYIHASIALRRAELACEGSLPWWARPSEPEAAGGEAPTAH